MTAAKLAANIIPSVNLCFDPFQRNYAQSAAAQDGRVRWYSGVPNGSRRGRRCGHLQRLCDPRADHDLGKKLWLAEMGVKIGDVMSFAIYAKVPTGRSVNAVLVWRLGATNLGAITSSTVVGDDGLHLLTITWPSAATCTSLDLYIGQVGSSGDVDVYAWYTVKGSILQTDMLTEGVLSTGSAH